MASLEPMETYAITDVAPLIGVGEIFLLQIVAKGIKAGVIPPQKDYSIRGCDLSRLGRIYHYQFEAELHRQAYLRVQQRDDDELQEKLDRGA